MGLISLRAARLASVVIFLLLAAAAASAARAEPAGATPGNTGETVAGTWAGVLAGSSTTVRHEQIVIVVNADQSAGTWRLSATCHGRLTLDSVSGGYHHYRRRLAAEATCSGGDVDCLMRVGANLYDSVTPHPGGAALSGTLRRVRPR